MPTAWLVQISATLARAWLVLSWKTMKKSRDLTKGAVSFMMNKLFFIASTFFTKKIPLDFSFCFFFLWSDFVSMRMRQVQGRLPFWDVPQDWNSYFSSI